MKLSPKVPLFLLIGLAVVTFTSCMRIASGEVDALLAAPVTATDSVVVSTRIATGTFLPSPCLEPGYPGTIHYANSDSFGDGYVARIPIEDVADKPQDAIVRILVKQWLEHYKIQRSVASASINDYQVEKIQLIHPSCDPFFEIVAGVQFSIIPSQIPHDMASFHGEEIKEGDLWWHLSAPFGVFADGHDYRLRLVFGWGT